MKIKMNGYRPSHRNKWKLLENKIITKDQLLLWDYYLDQMDFDIKHHDFGTFKVDFSKIASLLGYKKNKSNNSIRTKHNNLVKLGFIHPTTEKNIFKIYNPKRYVAQSRRWKGEIEDFTKSEMNQPVEIIVQNIATNIQLNENKFQTSEKKNEFLLNKNVSRDLGSSKVKSRVANNKHDEQYNYLPIRSDISQADVKLINESLLE